MRWALLGLLVVAAAVALLLLRRPGPAASPLPLSSPTPWVLPTPGPPTIPTPTPTPIPPPTPTSVAVIREPPSSSMRLLIPSIGLEAAIVPVGLEPNGALASPKGPDLVGWLVSGPSPGEQGNVLLSGHLDWRGPPPRTAVFYRLRELSPGQQVITEVEGRRAVYTVRESLFFRGDDPEAVRVLFPSKRSLLTLITCEGPDFDPAAGVYSHRRVVIAELQGSGG